MKNTFKRLIALGLASVQAAGFMSVGAFAESYSEEQIFERIQDEIAQREAEQNQENDVSAYSGRSNYGYSPFSFKADSGNATIHVEDSPITITADNETWVNVTGYDEKEDTYTVTLTVENVSKNDVTYNPYTGYTSYVDKNAVVPAVLETNGQKYEANKDLSFSGFPSDAITLKPGETRKYKYTVDLTKKQKDGEMFSIWFTAEYNNTSVGSAIGIEYSYWTTDRYNVVAAPGIDLNEIGDIIACGDQSPTTSYYVYPDENGSYFTEINSENIVNVTDITAKYEDTILTGTVDNASKTITFSEYKDLREVKFTVPEGYKIENVDIYEYDEGNINYNKDYIFLNIENSQTFSLRLPKSKKYNYELRALDKSASDNDSKYYHMADGDITAGDSYFKLDFKDFKLVNVNVNTPYIPEYLYANYYYSDKNSGYFRAYDIDSAENDIIALADSRAYINVEYPHGVIRYRFDKLDSSLKLGNNLFGKIELKDTSIKSTNELRFSFNNIFDEFNNYVSSLVSRRGYLKAVFTFTNKASGDQYTTIQDFYMIDGNGGIRSIALPDGIPGGDYSVSVEIVNDAYQYVTVSGDCTVKTSINGMTLPSGKSLVSKGDLIIEPVYKEGYNTVIKINGKEVEVEDNRVEVELGDEPLVITVENVPTIPVKIDGMVVVKTADGKEISDGDMVGIGEVLTITPKETASDGTLNLIYVNGQVLSGNTFTVSVTESVDIWVDNIEVPEDMGALGVSSGSLDIELYEGYTEDDAKAAAVKFTLSNMGKGDVETIVTTSSEGADDFIIITDGEKEILEPGKTMDVSIAPKTGLEVSEQPYTGFIGFNYENSVTTPAEIPFTITVKELQAQNAPSAPVIEKSDKTSITLKEIPANENGAKAQYRINEGEWQYGNVFSDLKPDTEYTFEARYEAVKGFKESAPSAKSKFVTVVKIADKEQKAPAAPTLVRADTSSITLKEIPVNENGAKAQYRVNGGEWQYSNVFRGLSANTAYTFEVRYEAVPGFKESPSASAKYSTTQIPSGGNTGNNNRPPVSGGSENQTVIDTTPTDSQGNKTTWTDVAAQISSGNVTGAITLGKSAAVPATVLKTLADKGQTVVFKVDDTFSWTVDGSNISGKIASASFAIGKADIPIYTINQAPGLANITAENTRTFKLDKVSFGVKPILKANLGAANVGSFANLYKLNENGVLEFVGTAKIAADGSAEVPVTADGSYVIAIDKESKLSGDFSNDGKLDVTDVSNLLKQLLSNNITTGSYKADVNGDGQVNALDAIAILRAILKN